MAFVNDDDVPDWPLSKCVIELLSRVIGHNSGHPVQEGARSALGLGAVTVDRVSWQPSCREPPATERQHFGALIGTVSNSPPRVANVSLALCTSTRSPAFRPNVWLAYRFQFGSFPYSFNRPALCRASAATEIASNGKPACSAICTRLCSPSERLSTQSIASCACLVSLRPPSES
jgi:hypothetical protein